MNATDANWRRRQSVAFTGNEDHVVVLSLAEPQQAKPRLLAGLAAAVWHALASPRSELELAGLVDASTGFGSEESLRVMRSFLADLEVQGLVEAQLPPA